MVNNHISGKSTATLSGYCPQYMRRLLRIDRLTGMKVGQFWLADLEFLKEYLNRALNSKDQRFSPQYKETTH
jgi:hypothetical protein